MRTVRSSRVLCQLESLDDPTVHILSCATQCSTTEDEHSRSLALQCSSLTAGFHVLCSAALCSAGCKPLDHLEICSDTNLEMIQRLTSCASQCSATEDEHSIDSSKEENNRRTDMEEAPSKEVKEGQGEGDVDVEAGEVWGWSWGAGTDGQLGTGSFRDEHLPQPLRFSPPPPPPPLSVSRLACGGAHSIALTSDGAVLSWGRNDRGQLGHGNFENCGMPKPVKFFEGFRIQRVSAGWNHSAFVTDMGRLYMCGDGIFGQLGIGDIQSCNVPSEVAFFGLENVEVEDVACGMRHTLALVNGKRVYGFGSNRHGQVGSNLSKTQKTCKLPEVVHGFEDCKVEAVFANGDRSAALTDNGQLYIWGRAFSGKVNYSHPRIVPSSSKFSQVALGWHHAVLLSDFDVYMIGNYRHAQHSGSTSANFVQDQSFPSALTTENDEDPLVPLMKKVEGLEGKKIVQIASGAEHSALLTDEGSVMTWGWGEHGQLGLGDTCDQALPRMVNLGEPSSQSTVRLAVYCGSGYTVVTREQLKPSIT